MTTIFETDHRLRNLIHTNVTVRNAYQMALRDGDDMDALIMAVLVLAQTNETLLEALQEYLEHTPPPIYVEATPQVIEFVKTLKQARENL